MVVDSGQCAIWSVSWRDDSSSWLIMANDMADMNHPINGQVLREHPNQY